MQKLQFRVQSKVGPNLIGCLIDRLSSVGLAASHSVSSMKVPDHIKYNNDDDNINNHMINHS